MITITKLINKIPLKKLNFLQKKNWFLSTFSRKKILQIKFFIKFVHFTK